MEDMLCPICTQVFCVPCLTPCGHVFCKSCISQWITEHAAATCPTCRGSLRLQSIAVDTEMDSACQKAYPAEWQAHRNAAAAAANELWTKQLPFLLCEDRECAEMVMNLTNVDHYRSVSKPVSSAMLSLPRKWFLPPSVRSQAYDSYPIRLNNLFFNISAPEVYAHALELLSLEPGHSVLDIGSGCGLLTCLAGILVTPGGKALGVDIRERAVGFARKNLEAARTRITSTVADASIVGSLAFEGKILPGADSDELTSPEPEKKRPREDESSMSKGGSEGEAQVQEEATERTGESGSIPGGTFQSSGDPDHPRAMLRITRNLGRGYFDGVLSRCESVEDPPVFPPFLHILRP